MTTDRTFRRHVCAIAAVHVMAVVLLYVISAWQRKPSAYQVSWLDGGSMGGDTESAAEASPEPVANQRPERPEEPPLKAEPPPPLVYEPPSELVLRSATPRPTPKPTPTPKATPRPTPRPTPPEETSPDEKAAATPTPRPATPKRTTPKVTPKHTPAKPATPKPGPEEPGNATPKVAAVKAGNSPSPAKGESGSGVAADKGTARTAGAAGGSGTGVGNGKGAGKAGGGASGSEFGWYFSMIHDRFHSRWDQPTNLAHASQDIVTMLKIRIGTDGSILSREIVQTSGETTMDQSVMTAAERVRQIDPLPAGLGTGDGFEIKIAFKLDQTP